MCKIRTFFFHRLNELADRWVAEEVWTYATQLTWSQLWGLFCTEPAAFQPQANNIAKPGARESSDTENVAIQHTISEPAAASADVFEWSKMARRLLRWWRTELRSPNARVQSPRARCQSHAQHASATDAKDRAQTSGTPSAQESEGADIHDTQAHSDSARMLARATTCPPGVALDLVLDGVDTAATVYLGGMELVRVANFHRYSDVR